MAELRPPRFFGIVPACGQSTRMGSPKLLLPGKRGKLIDDVLLAWQAGGVDRVVVVVRRDDLPLQQAVAQHPLASLVLADDPPEMKLTVQIALEYLQRAEQPLPTDAWLLAPADMPQLSPAMIRELSEQFRTHQPTVEILLPTIASKRGHPVLFPWAMQEEVFRLPADAGINRLLETLPVRKIPCDHLATGANPFLDVDSPEDYQRFQGGSPP